MAVRILASISGWEPCSRKPSAATRSRVPRPSVTMPAPMALRSENGAAALAGGGVGTAVGDENEGAHGHDDHLEQLHLNLNS